MSFRLQRSVKIAKGVRLNVSKSGLGVSVGPRGAKISAGPRGVYANAGIPGTGISTRKKISGNTQTRNNQIPSQTNESRQIRVQISIDDETGAETVSLYDGDQIVNDESLLRKIKKDSSYKSKLEEVRKQVFEEVLEKTNLLVEIHKHSEKMTDWNEISNAVNAAQPESYIKKKFDKKSPEKKDIQETLESEAKNSIKGLFGIKKKRQEYIDQNLDSRYSDLVNKWNDEKNNFDNKESEIEEIENKKYIDEFNSWKTEMKRLLEPDSSYIEERLTDLFSEIQLPADFSVSFDVRNAGKEIILDIDLPEIEDFPNKKAQRLASGKISVKNKTQKELKEDYFTSISGLGIYIASIAFTAAPTIKNILTSGYTQRTNKATGNIEDQYVYSVKFDKENFSKLNFLAIDPKLTLQSFENKCSVSKTYELKTIEPIE